MKKLGLVLGGGGARGIYEIGAWIAFQSCGLHFQVVSGTSIGALVGAMYTQKTLSPVLDFVYHLSPDQIVTDMMEPQEALENKEALFEFFKSYLKEGMDVSPLRNEIEKMLDYDGFMASDIEFACMTYNLSQHEGQAFYKQDFTRENAVDILMASASCYPAFPMTTIGEERFIDGGYEDNLPISLALDMGAEELYVVDVHGIGFVKHVKSDCIIHRLEPLLPLGHILDFSQSQGMRSLELGFLETMKYLNEYCGYVYTFYAEDWPKMYMIEQYLQLNFEQRSIEWNEFLVDDVMGYHVPALHNKFFDLYRFGRWIECLAWVCDLNPVQIDSYDRFLMRLRKALKKKYEKKEGLLYAYYVRLEQNAGTYPLLLDAIRPITYSEYYLAYVWYFLDLYLKKA